jgi:hypothetical protein
MLHFRLLCLEFSRSQAWTLVFAVNKVGTIDLFALHPYDALLLPVINIQS